MESYAAGARGGATPPATEIAGEFFSGREAPDRPSLAFAARSRPPRAAPRERSGARAVALALAVVAATMAAVASRATIVAALPLSAPLFAGIGLPVNTRGMTFAAVRGTFIEIQGGRVLAVEGEIANARGATLAIPTLALTVRGHGRELYRWTATAPKATLAAGERVAFRSRLVAPPEGAEEVEVAFTDDRARPGEAPATPPPAPTPPDPPARRGAR
jgi:hypothetical protein